MPQITFYWKNICDIFIYFTLLRVPTNSISTVTIYTMLLRYISQFFALDFDLDSQGHTPKLVKMLWKSSWKLLRCISQFSYIWPWATFSRSYTKFAPNALKITMEGPEIFAFDLAKLAKMLRKLSEKLLRCIPQCYFCIMNCTSRVMLVITAS